MRVSASVFRLFVVALAAATGINGAVAQTAMDPVDPAPALRAPILTIDIDRVFSESDFGQRLISDLNAQRTALAAENREIAETLRADELALAARRSSMDPEAFVAAAEAFDERARAVRQEQDAKAQELENGLTVARTQFVEATRPILGELMVERGAASILDQRVVLLSLSSVDITEDALERVNTVLGDGAASGSEEAEDSQ